MLTRRHLIERLSLVGAFVGAASFGVPQVARAQGAHGGRYNGGQLQAATDHSEALIQTACNLLEHCKVASSAGEGAAVRSLETLGEDAFAFAGDSFIHAAAPWQAQAYVAYRSDAIVIAFRGSGVDETTGDPNIVDIARNILGTATNMFVDASIVPVRDEIFPGRVHIGFLHEYKTIRDVVRERYSTARRRAPDARVYITGFSLGGALATLCAYDLANTFGLFSNLYLFASPAAGNEEFARAFGGVGRAFRFAHENDIVPQLPASLFCGYQETGTKLFVFDDGGRQVRPDDLSVQVRANRTLAAASTVGSAALIPAVVRVVRSFWRWHTPEYYKGRLVEHCDHYGSYGVHGLSPSATVFRQLCERHCIGFD